MEYLTSEERKFLEEDTSTESDDYGQEYLTYEERKRMQDTDSESNHSFGEKQAATRIVDSVQEMLESSFCPHDLREVLTKYGVQSCLDLAAQPGRNQQIKADLEANSSKSTFDTFVDDAKCGKWKNLGVSGVGSSGEVVSVEEGPTTFSLDSGKDSLDLSARARSMEKMASRIADACYSNGRNEVRRRRCSILLCSLINSN
jgi:hypothetical protein